MPANRLRAWRLRSETADTALASHRHAGRSPSTGGPGPRSGRSGDAVAARRRRGGAAGQGRVRDAARVLGQAVPAGGAPGAARALGRGARARRARHGRPGRPRRGRARACGRRRRGAAARVDAGRRRRAADGVCAGDGPARRAGRDAGGGDCARVAAACHRRHGAAGLAVAPGRRQVDELCRQHGRPARGPQARRRRRALPLARGHRARVPDVERVVRRGRRAAHARRSISASWPG